MLFHSKLDAMASTSNVSANQSNHGSSQFNGMTINHAIFNSRGGTPLVIPPPEPCTPTDDFYFGLIPSLDEEQDDETEPEPIARSPPIIDRADMEAITEISDRVLDHYRDALRQTARARTRCVQKLRDRVQDQKIRIGTHVRAIKKWPSFPAKPQRGRKPDPAAIESKVDLGMTELKSKLEDIHQNIERAVDLLPDISRHRQGYGNERQVRNSSIFNDVGRLVDEIERDIPTIESLVFQKSGSRRPFETTRGFARLYVSSSATRTLYRHLCQACPRSGKEQGHGHTALVGLVPVPDKEPLRIVPNEVAVTAHVVAIESTLKRGDYIWFEANSRLLLPGGGEDEAVCSEPSSPQLVIDGLRQRRDSGYSSTSSPSPTEEAQASQSRRDSGEFCRIQVCPGSLAQGSNLLAMCIGDDYDSGHQIFYLHEDKRPESGCKPLNLCDIIEEGEKQPQRGSRCELYKRSRHLRGHRFKIALKIAEATLRYGWREWLGDAWGIQDILFYPVESERMPFLRADIVDKGCGGKLDKFMFNLGIVLLQLGLWERLRIQAPGGINNKHLDMKLSRLGKETSAPFQEAVRYCTGFSKLGDCELGDNDHMFQQIFYQKVISPLREMVKGTEENKGC